MNLHSPEPLKHQPWYTHCNLPHWSILPSDKGANLWGQASSNTCQAPSFLSHHTTTSSPITFLPCGALLSRSQIGISGYHCEYQSNFSACASTSVSASGRLLGSVNGEGDKAVKSLDFDLFQWTKENGELTWLLFKNMDFLSGVVVVSGAVGMWSSERTEEATIVSMFPCCKPKQQTEALNTSTQEVLKLVAGVYVFIFMWLNETWGSQLSDSCYVRCKVHVLLVSNTRHEDLALFDFNWLFRWSKPKNWIMGT